MGWREAGLGRRKAGDGWAGGRWKEGGKGRTVDNNDMAKLVKSTS